LILKWWPFTDCVIVKLATGLSLKFTIDLLSKMIFKVKNKLVQTPTVFKNEAENGISEKNI
jgi:hypothetical protein